MFNCLKQCFAKESRTFIYYVILVTLLFTFLSRTNFPHLKAGMVTSSKLWLLFWACLFHLRCMRRGWWGDPSTVSHWWPVATNSRWLTYRLPSSQSPDELQMSQTYVTNIAQGYVKPPLPLVSLFFLFTSTVWHHPNSSRFRGKTTYTFTLDSFQLLHVNFPEFDKVNSAVIREQTQEMQG